MSEMDNGSLAIQGKSSIYHLFGLVTPYYELNYITIVTESTVLDPVSTNTVGML